MTLPLFADRPPVPEHRVRALAGVLAGFGWPERGGSFERLPKAQQALALDVARDALARLQTEGT